MLLSNDQPLVIVKSFNNIFKGMDYYNSFSENSDVLDKVKDSYISFFIISPENYSELYKNKDVKSYETFFNQNYK